MYSPEQVKPLLSRFNDYERLIADALFGVTTGVPMETAEVATSFGVSLGQVADIGTIIMLHLDNHASLPTSTDASAPTAAPAIEGSVALHQGHPGLSPCEIAGAESGHIEKDVPARLPISIEEVITLRAASPTPESARDAEDEERVIDAEGSEQARRRGLFADVRDHITERVVQRRQ